MWFRRKKTTKDDEQRDKITSSQKLLLDAAVSTADMAQYVTTRLKESLDDAVKQFEVTASIMSDALIMCDAKGKMKASNPAALKMFDYESSSIFMRKSVLDLFHSGGSIITTSDELWSILGADNETVKLTGVRRRHQCFPIEVAMSHLGRADGAAIVLMLIRDMSDIIALKKEAEATNRRYRSLFELCFDGIVVVQNDKIVAANQQAGRLFGVRAESLLNVHFTRLVNEEDREKLTEHHREPTTVYATRPDGKPMALLLSGTDITWNDDPAYLVTIRDLKR